MQCKKPISVFKKPVHLKLSCFKGLFNALKDTATRKFENIPADLCDLFGVEIETSESGKVWTLVTKILVSTILDFLKEKQLIGAFNADIADKYDVLINTFLEDEFEVDQEFFSEPINSRVLADCKKLSKNFLRSIEFSDNDIRSMLANFDCRFLTNLNNEWLLNSKDFQGLASHFETPFQDAIKKLIKWNEYQLFLVSQIDENILGEEL